MCGNSKIKIVFNGLSHSCSVLGISQACVYRCRMCFILLWPLYYFVNYIRSLVCFNVAESYVQYRPQKTPQLIGLFSWNFICNHIACNAFSMGQLVCRLNSQLNIAQTFSLACTVCICLCYIWTHQTLHVEIKLNIGNLLRHVCVIFGKRKPEDCL